MLNGEDDARREWLALLASRLVDRVTDYVRRGRHYSCLCDEKLVLAWCNVVERLARDSLNTQLHSEERDLNSEFSLRGLQPPYEKVAQAFEMITNSSKRELDRLSAQDPGLDDRINAEIAAELQALRDEPRH